ncbi:MAG: hypothetical protein VB018_05095 [Lachnospiraceae bacterium]|nr:hypothetical protein [Lachnospiraceae bacterium]
MSELEEIKLVENVTVNSSNLVRNLQILEGRRDTIVAVGNLSDNYDNNLTE